MYVRTRAKILFHNKQNYYSNWHIASIRVVVSYPKYGSNYFTYHLVKRGLKFAGNTVVPKTPANNFFPALPNNYRSLALLSFGGDGALLVYQEFFSERIY